MQRQAAVTAYLKSKQLLLFVFVLLSYLAGRYMCDVATRHCSRRYQDRVNRHTYLLRHSPVWR